MATIDIGKLTFTHKGDYSGSTAYVLNDVVYYNGSAYIAKTSTTGNLPTSTAHWNVFSAGSGGIWNSGLSLGSAGQVVKVNSGASALEFGTVSSDFVKLASGSQSVAAGSLSIDGYFSSTYKVYKLFINGWRPTSTDHFGMRVNVGGSQRNDSNYRYNQLHAYRDSSSQSTGNAGNAWNATEFRTNTDAWNTSRGNGLEWTFYDPADATDNNFQAMCQMQWRRNDNATFHQVYGGFTYDQGANAISGVLIFPTGGNNQVIDNWALYGIKF